MTSFASKTAQGLTPLVLPETGDVIGVAVDVNWNEAKGSLAVGEVVRLCTLPAGVELVGWRVAGGVLDTNATPTLAFDLGVLNDAQTALRLEPTANFGTVLGASGVTEASGATGFNCVAFGKTTERTLGLVVKTAAATLALAGQRSVILLELRA